MKAVIWTSPGCAESDMAKSLLELNSVSYEEKNATEEHWPHGETLECVHCIVPETGHCHIDITPEIFIDGEHIGNYTALKVFLLGHDFTKGVIPAREGPTIAINEEGSVNESINLE